MSEIDPKDLLSFSNFFPASPRYRPMFNSGCLMDITTGRFVEGKRGESILNGGVSYVTGVAGIGNVGKSVLGLHLMLTILARFKSARGMTYDTEVSATLDRQLDLTQLMEGLEGIDLEYEGRLFLTDKSMMYGDEFWDKLRELCDTKIDNAKLLTRTLPFVDGDRGGSKLTTLVPTISFIDSFSMLSTKPIDTKYEDNSIGSKDLQIDNMRVNLHKNQMMTQVPTVTARGGLFLILSAHVGQQHNLDPNAPPDKKLEFLKGKALKGVTEKYTFLTNNLWYVYNSSVLMNDTTKAPEYPLDQDDNLKGDTDLKAILIQNLRGKSGPTGLPFQVIYSQREGVLPGLTELHFLKNANARYGLGGNNLNYHLDLLPDVNLSRTTVRRKINESHALRRALQITSEMCQMRNIWLDRDKLFCTPKELYDDLIALGYDWEVLLNTRGYWVFEEDEKDEQFQFLSTMDLLRMRKGLYHPFWMAPLEELKAAKVDKVASKGSKKAA